MLCSRLRALMAAVILALTPSLPAMAADGTPQGTAIEQAIQAYASKLKLDQDNARDATVVTKADALLHDPGTHSLGNPTADVTIIEFFDYTCPFCKAVEPRLEQLLRADRNVKLIVKEFPILTPESLIAAKAALASAKQGKYDSYHQAMIKFRGQLKEATIFEIAQSVGLDIERLRQDMNAPEYADEIIQNFNLARSLRIVDTPTFIIGNHFITEPSGQIDFPKRVAAERGK